MSGEPGYQRTLQVAIEEAHRGVAERGIPIEAALFDARCVQENDPSVHRETDVFRKAEHGAGPAA